MTSASAVARSFWRALVGTAAAIFLTAPQAFSFQLTFDGLQNGEPIDNYYDGGRGGFGSGPGPSDGITFTSNSLAEIIGLPPFPAGPVGNPVALFTGTGDYMNVPAGFDTSLSFYYYGTAPGSVTVFSGLNGTGRALLTVTLPPDATFLGAGGFFSGVAKSVDFSSATNDIYFDNVTSGAVVLPEPASLTLLGAGLLAMAAWLRRKKRS